ncbi:MAG TPA: PqqD family protein [Gemmatimonadales bacterium]|nr:PqqD family protein [Gemmatimonadales bacterium]
MTLRYRRHPDLRLTALEGEGVVLHLGTRRYFSVNESGLAILEALKSPRTVDELVSALCERYDVTADWAEATVRAFLARCRDADVLLAESGS